MNTHLSPAPYSSTDEPETVAVDIFKTLLDHEKVKADVRERDKYPNTDGYVELVDENRIPVGKLEVQIKKLPDKFTTNPRIQCPVSLISYSEAATCNPVLLIGVDTAQNKAYWIHIGDDLISRLNRDNQRTKVIPFPDENIIDGEDVGYISKWKDLVVNYKTKIKEYDTLKRSYITLSKNANPTLSIAKAEFQSIHIFLDTINKFLDEKFSLVKKIYYPNTWKIGLAYYEYQDNTFSYTLYPISLESNEVQIKEVDEELHKQLKREGFGFTAHYVENPIKCRPKDYATEIIESKTMGVLENRLLNHQGNEALAREFIFAFFDKFYQQLGLDKKDVYSLEEIEKSFFQYLPMWIEEAVNFLVKVHRNGVNNVVDCLYGRPYFDPDLLIRQIMADERKQIDQSVRTKIKQGYAVPNISRGNDRLPLEIFTEFFNFLKSEGLNEVSRVYSPKDYSRSGGWVWGVYSPEVAEDNLRIFFRNLPDAYDSLVFTNFPELKQELALFGKASRIIVIFEVKNTYTSYQDSPKIEFFYLKGKDQDEITIEIYNKSEDSDIPRISHEDFDKEVEIEGKKYELISISRGILDFIYDDLPMFNFVYKTLEDNFKKYFAKQKRG
ncbi:MAG TPA: hypothetical protein VMW67_02165 [Desulfobacteria bacterium]|nr:hypothetical protein [Desulfobacteria bacterium]